MREDGVACADSLYVFDEFVQQDNFAGCGVSEGGYEIRRSLFSGILFLDYSDVQSRRPRTSMPPNKNNITREKFLMM